MKNKGFTLIELMVVIAIIGILMSLAFVSYMGAQKSARDGKRKTDLEQIRNALEMCRSDTGSYPTSLSPSGTCQPYFASLSKTDPVSGYTYPYGYTTNTYILCAYLETGAQATSCTASCPGNCGTVPCNYKTCNP